MGPVRAAGAGARVPTSDTGGGSGRTAERGTGRSWVQDTANSRSAISKIVNAEELRTKQVQQVQQVQQEKRRQERQWGKWRLTAPEWCRTQIQGCIRPPDSPQHPEVSSAEAPARLRARRQ